MPYKLTTTVKNIHSISNSINAGLKPYYEKMPYYRAEKMFH